MLAVVLGFQGLLTHTYDLGQQCLRKASTTFSLVTHHNNCFSDIITKLHLPALAAVGIISVRHSYFISIHQHNRQADMCNLLLTIVHFHCIMAEIHYSNYC
jgi:tryptophan-rich sensory protein